LTDSFKRGWESGRLERDDIARRGSEERWRGGWEIANRYKEGGTRKSEWEIANRYKEGRAKKVGGRLQTDTRKEGRGKAGGRFLTDARKKG
jgi:hypothetical protein